MASTLRDRTDLALAVVVRQGEGLGLRLTGVEVEEVAPGCEQAALHALRARRDLGVLAVEEAVLAAAEPAPVRRRDGGLPVIIPFTLPRRWAEPGRGRDLVAAMVRRAVGYHVKLGGTSP
jgi:V/A-type H+/Na+-transporting ATPase subunit F